MNKNIVRDIAFRQMLVGTINMMNETISLVQNVLYAMGIKLCVEYTKENLSKKTP